jgi:diguanylate cyclase (GGDEF)-like protein
VDVIVSDQRMPGLTGVEVLAQARNLRPDAVRIMLTGYADIEAVVQAVNEGNIYFYLTKPWEPFELESVLEKAVEHNRLVRKNRQLLEELKSANEELEDKVKQRTIELEKRNQELSEANLRIEELARHDPLTGLLNRRSLFELLGQHVVRCSRIGNPLSAMILDLDHFKLVNDSYGHAMGDRVLCAVAEYVSVNSRPYDLVGRYGGEEFVVILPDAGLEAAHVTAERYRGGICQLKVKDLTKTITASIGVTCLKKTDSIETLLDRADRALYRAKYSGRNRVEAMACTIEESFEAGK